MAFPTGKVAELIWWNTTYLSGLIKRSGEYQTVFMESTPEILSRLKFLSHIQKGDKLGSKTMTLQTDSWYTRFIRTWVTPDNRQNSLRLIKEVISRSFEILLMVIESQKESDIFQCRMIIADLVKCQIGLCNLKATYSDDTKFGCDMEILLQQIAARLSEIKQGHHHLFEPNILEQPIERKDPGLQLPAPHVESNV
jgi:hypothetical protein